MEPAQTSRLLDKLFNLSEIAWSTANIPTLVQAVLTFNAKKCSRTLLFEKVLAFFAELRAQLLATQDDDDDDDDEDNSNERNDNSDFV